MIAGRIAASCLFCLLATAGMAAEKITTKSQFLQIVQGKQMTLLGIRVAVSPEGQITGRAFGKPVSGKWEWRDGYFCRDLFWGERDFGPNCQEVSLRGSKIRFQSDRGAGQYADLNLK